MSGGVPNSIFGNMIYMPKMVEQFFFGVAQVCECVCVEM